jgi:hypothetical protein
MLAAMNQMNAMFRVRRAGARAWTLIMLAFLMLAQSELLAAAVKAAPQPGLKKAPQIWLGYLVMALLLAIVLAVSLMPSKRSHQD